jgi:uncharacterized membrane protein
MNPKSITLPDNVAHVTRVLLAATRVWLPVLIAIAGVVGIVIGHGRTGAAAAGVGLVIVALIVWMINWMFRMSVSSNRDRDREEEAREYFSRTGHWPDER